MAKDTKAPKPNVAGAGNNPTTSPEEQAKIDAAIFDQNNTPSENENETAASQAPVSNSELGSSNAEEKVTISRAQFENILQRLNDLDNQVLSSTTKKDDIFNPLAEVKTDHEVRLAYYGDELVVGYKGKIRPDGREMLTFMRKEPETQEMRTYITLMLQDENGAIREETVDYVNFLNEAVMIPAKLKNRKDVGQIVEQGMVEVLTWNGRTMVGTGTRIMSGAKEQKWIFTVEHNGKVFDLPENVVNIK